MGKKYLIIGDAHAKPDVPNDRFDWLGKLIMDEKPDVIVDIGDLEDMPSLAMMDYGKLCYEGRRYKQDLEAAWDARSKIRNPILNYNESQRKRKSKLYDPQFIALGGNHFEGRINRTCQLSPMLAGTIGVQDGRHEEFGWEYVPFLVPFDSDGISFCHYYQAGSRGKCVGGEYLGAALLRHKLSTCVMGHLHVFDVAHRTTPDRRDIWGIVCGCYLDPNQFEDYANQSNWSWDRGILILNGVSNGTFESFTWMGINEIQRRYAVAVDV